MSAPELRNRLRAVIAKEHDDGVGHLIDGKASDHGDYLARIAYLRGLRRVLQEIDEQYRQMHNLPAET